MGSCRILQINTKHPPILKKGESPLNTSGNTPNLDPDILSNITDMNGNKIIVKTSNYGTIRLFKDITETNDTYTAIDKTNLAGLRKIHLHLSHDNSSP